MRAPLVLLVEDDPLQLSYRAKLLSELGVEVQVAVDLRTARELIESRRFDVVVTDINLGDSPTDKSGLALAAEVHRIHPEVPVVGYSALYSSDDLEQSDLALFKLFFQKGSQRSSGVVEALRLIADLARASRDGGA